MGGQVADYTRHDRDAIIECARHGRLTDFANSAAAALIDCPEDVQLRLLLVYRLVESGLLHAARREAEQFPSEIRTSADFRDLMQRLRADRGNGLAHWLGFEKRYADNLAALRRRYSWADHIAEVWNEARPRMELHQTRQGYWVVFEKNERGGRWRPALEDHRPRETLAQLTREVANQILPPVIINGIGMGDHLSLIYEATRNTFLGSCPAIFQIESDWAAFAAVMHLHDWRSIIEDERVQVFGGDDAYELLYRALSQNSWLHTKPILLHPTSWNESATKHIVECMERRDRTVADRRAVLMAQGRRRYSGRDTSYWARRFAAARAGAEARLRVLGITSRFTSVLQYSMRDTLRALESLGCETRLLIEPTPRSRLSSTPKLEAINDFEPDLVLCIDHLRNGSPESMIENVPFVTWIQDRLPWLFCRAAGQNIGPLDFCMGFCRPELIDRYSYPSDRFMACEMATHPASLRSEESVAEMSVDSLSAPPNAVQTGALVHREDAIAWDCDLAFATNRGRTVEEIHGQCRREADASGRLFIDAVYEELLIRADQLELNAGIDVEYFMASMQERVGIQLAEEGAARVAKDMVRPLVDQLLRIQTIDWAVSWAEKTGRRFNLYGRGWDGHPRFGPYARGFIEHGPALGEAFRRAAVNLHAGINMALHQRVLDGLCAGGFFLIRDHANDLWYQFQPVLHEIIQNRRLKPGDQIRADDLPQHLRQRWVCHRRKTGRPSDMPYVLEPAHFVAIESAVSNDGAPLPLKIWPELSEIVFDSPTKLAERLNHFLDNETHRRAIRGAMRDKMLKSFSYKTLMGRLLDWLTATLAQRAA